MRKEIITLACAIGLLGTTSSAFAGAYGEPVQAEEAPVAAPAPVVAEEPEIDYGAPGFYLGLGGQYAIEFFDAGPIDASNSPGFHVEAGYRVIPNLALEARYENYTEFDTDEFNEVPRNKKGDNGGHLSGWSLTANAKAYALTGRWQPYGLIGLGYINMDPDNNGVDGDNGAFVMRFGGGMEAWITENISMGPEIAYVLPISSDDIEDLDFLTVGLGLKYIFR